jgi:hypothetical protein
MLRRVTQHVLEQNWTAIVIDFAIVVLGVFIGIQVSNLNANRSDLARERLLLAELRAELAGSIQQVAIKQDAFRQVGRSGERSSAFLDAGRSCGDACWGVIVDFFHASQWQTVVLSRSTYDEMRRNGWPRNRAIVEALEAHHRQADQITFAINEPPVYRELVRGLIPLSIHRPYWQNCFAMSDGEERYLEECAEGVDPAVSAAGVAAIMANPGVRPALTVWAGFAAGLDAAFTGQVASTQRAIALIDAELNPGGARKEAKTSRTP